MTDSSSSAPNTIRNLAQIVREEWQEIHERRRAAGFKPDADATTAQASSGAGASGQTSPVAGASGDATPPRQLVGLALSGGGIRSATFCLGLLQGLHAAGLLRIFDYLSTVSGGGYTGGWWSAWLSRTDPNNHKITDPQQRGGEDIFPPPEALGPFTGIYDNEQLIGESKEVKEHKSEQLKTATSKKISPEDFKDLESAGNDPLHHLRLYGNYLTPRKGALSADTWSAAAIISRNLLLTWLVLLPLLVAVVLAGQLYFTMHVGVDGCAQSVRSSLLISFPAASLPVNCPPPTLQPSLWLFAWPLLGIIIWVATLICAWMINSGDADTLRKTYEGWAGAVMVGVIMLVIGLVWYRWSDAASNVPLPTWKAVGLWLVAGGALIYRTLRLPEGDRAATAKSSLGERRRKHREVRRNQIMHLHARLLIALVFGALVLGVAGFGHYCDKVIDYAIASSPVAGALQKAGGWGALLLSVAGSIYTALKTAPSGGHDSREVTKPNLVSRVIFTITPPLVLLVLAVLSCWLANAFLVNVNRKYVVPGNEKLVNLLTATICLGVVLALVFALNEMYWKGERRSGANDHKPWPHWVQAVPTTLLAFIALLRFLHALTSFGDWRRLWFVDLGVVPEPPLVSFLALGFIACVTLLILRRVRGAGANQRTLSLIVAAIVVISTLALFGWLDCNADALKLDRQRLLLVRIVFALVGLLLMWLVAFGWMADPNALSLHLFYKARLVRAYLGASNLRRGEKLKRVTEAAEGDDVPLHRLRNCQRGAPYHLVNTTLNLVGGRDLATAQRSSDYFTLSRRYCGSSRTGYIATEPYMSGRMTLGTAVAVSGAAASPNMGAMTLSATLAMLMTLLNVRLGFWAPTPNKSAWQETSARLWPFYMLREFFSQTNDLSSYCYLTDGGHFDNTGLYSLVARACRFIVVADCGADPRPCFQDLGTALRRCRIDFGAEISLNLSPLERDTKNGDMPTTTFKVGKIRYDPRHLYALYPPAPSDQNSADYKNWRESREEWMAQARDGIIVVIKPALSTGKGEPADVRQYGLENGQFPQQSTADLWYDEAQFESYRRLGQQCADVAFGVDTWRDTDAAPAIEGFSHGRALTTGDVAQMFKAMFQG